MTDLDLPGDISLDLDAYERPAADVRPPFAVLIGGRRVVMTDPEEIDWQDLIDMETPVEFLRHCVSDDDREFLREQKIPGFKFGVLMDRYMKHFKLDDKVEKARRDQSRRF